MGDALSVPFCSLLTEHSSLFSVPIIIKIIIIIIITRRRGSMRKK